MVQIMARGENPSGSVAITITVSEPIARLLKRLAKGGLYGRTRAEVAAQFVQKETQRIVESGLDKLIEAGFLKSEDS